MRSRIVVLGSLGIIATIAAACGSAEPQGLCPAGQILVNGQCLEDLPVAVNGEGLLPSRQKRTAFRGASPKFEIVDADSGDVVWEGTGTLTPLVTGSDEPTYSGDFTEFSDEGKFFIRANEAESARFVIGPDALVAALEAAMLGLSGQRCGAQVKLTYADDTFTHGACHLAPASMSRVGDEAGTKDDVGGWHDAGDYGKYVRNGAFAVAFLLAAYEHFPDVLDDWEFDIPERGGDVPDMLDEARVELEWILKTQFDDGSFAHKVTALNFEGQVAPTSDVQERYFFSTSSHSTANAVAVLASAGRLYVDYDEEFASKCLKAAKKGQTFLDENPQEIESDQSGANTGTYAGGGGDADERAWALAELWETTGTERYLREYEVLATAGTYLVSDSFDWPDTRNLGIGTYLLSEREGRDETAVETVTRAMVQSADKAAAASLADPFGRGLNDYYWGSSGVVARMTFNLSIAHRIYPNTAYLDAMSLKVAHLLGLNSSARSWVTGLGTNPPQNPHHRPSATDSVGLPWPGLLIGGAQSLEDPWNDAYESYQTNEIAINWNTALIYALVAAHSTQEDDSAKCVPDCLPPLPTAGEGGAGGAGN